MRRKKNGFRPCKGGGTDFGLGRKEARVFLSEGGERLWTEEGEKGKQSPSYSIGKKSSLGGKGGGHCAGSSGREKKKKGAKVVPKRILLRRRLQLQRRGGTKKKGMLGMKQGVKKKAKTIQLGGGEGISLHHPGEGRRCLHSSRRRKRDGPGSLSQRKKKKKTRTTS